MAFFKETTLIMLLCFMFHNYLGSWGQMMDISPSSPLLYDIKCKTKSPGKGTSSSGLGSPRQRIKKNPYVSYPFHHYHTLYMDNLDWVDNEDNLGTRDIEREESRSVDRAIPTAYRRYNIKDGPGAKRGNLPQASNVPQHHLQDTFKESKVKVTLEKEDDRDVVEDIEENPESGANQMSLNKANQVQLPASYPKVKPSGQFPQISPKLGMLSKPYQPKIPSDVTINNPKIQGPQTKSPQQVHRISVPKSYGGTQFQKINKIPGVEETSPHDEKSHNPAVVISNEKPGHVPENLAPHGMMIMPPLQQENWEKGLVEAPEGLGSWKESGRYGDFLKKQGMLPKKPIPIANSQENNAKSSKFNPNSDFVDVEKEDKKIVKKVIEIDTFSDEKEDDNNDDKRLPSGRGLFKLPQFPSIPT